MINNTHGAYQRLSPHPAMRGISKARRGTDAGEELEAFAAKLERGLASAVLAAFEATKAAVSEDDLVAAIQAGDVGKVLALLGLPFESMAGPVQRALQDATFKAGHLGAQQVATRIVGAQFHFNQINPRLIDWLQTYSLGLIKQIDQGTKEGIRQYLVAGMQAGANPRATAREVRQVIGLTDRQAQAVKNFRKELQTFHLRRAAGGWNLGGKISRAPGGAQTYAIDDEGLPKDGIMERRLRDFRFDGQLSTALKTGKPLTPAQIDKMVDAYARKYLKHRSENIARTEALRTTNFGVQDAWRQAIEQGKVQENLVRRQWVLAKDERTCPTCAPIPKLNPKRGVPFGQPFQTPKGGQFLPPMHPSCVPGDTHVSAGHGITGVSKRWYVGELVTIRTASGKKLSATPNHPVLTRAGWVAAGLIQEGSDVISRAGANRLGGGVDDDQDVPPTIEQVAAALLGSGEMASAEVPVTSEDFHGDGAGSQVAVVGAHRLLVHDADATLSQEGGQLEFKVRGEIDPAPLAGDGAQLSFAGSCGSSAACGMCGGDLGRPSVWGHGGPLGRFGLTLATPGDAVLQEDPADGGAADADLASKLLLGSSGKVFADQVIEVRRDEFAGHVYNLETVQRHYTANGVITHNCRCTVLLRAYEPQQLQDQQP